MGDVRIKIAVAAVCVGLGGLGGFAMASNPVMYQQAPAPLVSSPNGSQTTAPVTSGASGAAATTGGTAATPGTAVAVPVAPNAKANAAGGPRND